MSDNELSWDAITEEEELQGLLEELHRVWHSPNRDKSLYDASKAVVKWIDKNLECCDEVLFPEVRYDRNGTGSPAEYCENLVAVGGGTKCSEHSYEPDPDTGRDDEYAEM